VTKTVISLRDANNFLSKHHYLGGCTPGQPDAFGWIENGILVAVAMYGLPHAPKIPKSYRDLRRLARSDHMIAPLSKFLSQTLRHLKLAGWDAAITWADQERGHHGGIYQATNWIYVQPQSYNWNSSYRLPDGSVRDHRSVFKEFGTTAKSKLEIMRPTWVPFLPKQKLKYVFPMAARISEIEAMMNVKSSANPKPMGEELVRRDFRGDEVW
jgi:hypothetical protein